MNADLHTVKDIVNMAFWVVASVGGSITAFVALRQKQRDLAQAKFNHEQKLKLDIYRDLGGSLAAASEALVKAATTMNALPDTLRARQAQNLPLTENAKKWTTSKAAEQASHRLEELSITLEKYAIVFPDEMRTLGRKMRNSAFALTVIHAQYVLAATPFLADTPIPSLPPGDLQGLDKLAKEYEALCTVVVDEDIRKLQIHAQNSLLGALFTRLPLVQ